MTRRFAAALLVIAVALPLYADFGALARAIDGKSGVKRIWIPLLGLARFAVRAVEPKGVNDFQLATFEGADRLDPRDLQAMMREKLGRDFHPLVQVWSRKGGSREFSFIYARPHANSDRIELVILAHDDEDTALVRVDVNADVVARELGEPRNVTRMARH